MAQSSTAELVRRLFEAYASGGVEASLAFVHPEITWHAPPEWLEERVYRGHDGLRELADFWDQQFEDYRLVLERTIELDDGRVLALLYQRGRISGSDAEVEQEVGYLVCARDGLLSRVDVHFSWAAAMDAAAIEM